MLRLIAPVFLATTGLTNCQYFSNVTVPATDTTPPTAIVSAYDVATGNYDKTGFGQPLSMTVTDPTLTYLAIAAGLDGGGTQSVSISGGISINCTNDNGIGSTTFEDLAPQTGTQPGGVGSTVSDGVWMYYVVRFDQLADCPASGFRVTSVNFGWSSEVSDYHGNTSSTFGNMTYRP
jgi:hypothetical protein